MIAVESVFPVASNVVRKASGCLSRKTALVTVLQLMMPAKKKWQRLPRPNRVSELSEEAEFQNGIKQLRAAA